MGKYHYSAESGRKILLAELKLFIFSSHSPNLHKIQITTIIGIGFYPKLITQIYDPTVNQLVQTAWRSVPSLGFSETIAQFFLNAPTSKALTIGF